MRDIGGAAWGVGAVREEVCHVPGGIRATSHVRTSRNSVARAASAPPAASAPRQHVAQLVLCLPYPTPTPKKGLAVYHPRQAAPPFARTGWIRIRPKPKPHSTTSPPSQVEQAQQGRKALEECDWPSLFSDGRTAC
jgi:hypothetical protein